MSIHLDPANTRLATDVKIYRDKVLIEETRREIEEHLVQKDPSWAGATPAELASGEAYCDFVAWQASTTPGVSYRLGGGLDATVPARLTDLPRPVPGNTVTWPSKGVSAQIRDDGAVIHEDEHGNEIHEAHEYMHGIFDTILYEARRLFEAVNVALEEYAKVVSVTNPANVQAGNYRNAVTALEKFIADLQPGGGSPFAMAFNWVSIRPVVTNEGFIVSCRVKLNWKNPYHSSSTIKIP